MARDSRRTVRMVLVSDGTLAKPYDSVKTAEQMPAPAGPEQGQWYWVTESKRADPVVVGVYDESDWLGCVVKIGTNYVELDDVNGSGQRIHVNNFERRCRRELCPDEHIDAQVAAHQAEVVRLMARVAEITARLGVAPSPALSTGSETAALATISSTGDTDTYKAALIKAKTTDLPDLFKQIEQESKLMSRWMKAKLIPLRAQADSLQSSIGAIADRIFSVELYAGLQEQVERIADGEPAPLATKIHLMQRLCYMDEECLANYRAGGMDYSNIGQFDAWLTDAENLDRLLPFPRCVVAFQIRRKERHRAWDDLWDLIRIQDEAKADKATYLYIRNGAQVYRLRTGIDFGKRLFPDTARSRLRSAKLYAKVFGGSVDGVVSEDEYLGIIEDVEERRAQWERKDKAHKAEKAALLAKGLDPHKMSLKNLWPGFEPSLHDDYVPYSPETVRYDDITKYIANQIKDHNRIAIVLQGLLDRSPVLHPHPPWRLWTDEGFSSALELVYDDSRALNPAELPDFEAYRARLNALIREGSVTVGQQPVWEAKDRDSKPVRGATYRDPGPGRLARVEKVKPRAGTVTYAWKRERSWNTRGHSKAPIRRSITCKLSEVFNVDAYTPGDFKQFFADPRTRADYIQWAPLLLEAEEYHAGNRAAAPPPPPPARKPPSSREGRRRYRNKKLRDQFMGKAVRLTRDIEFMSGASEPTGSLWRVHGGEGATFRLEPINADGSHDMSRRYANGLHLDDFEVDPTIPENET